MSGRWLLPAGDTGMPAYSVHQQESGPLTEIDFGKAGAPILQFRCLADLDDLIGVLTSARAAHGQAQARHAARPLMPLTGSDVQPDPYIDAIAAEHGSEYETGHTIDLGPGAVMEVLVDPDCIAGKHASCMGGPCTCSCHATLPDLPHRAPSPALNDEPTCDEMDGNFACTASPLHAGDHASHDRDGNVIRQWAQVPPAPEET